ncbi:MAG: cation diffusion facilitator family transporter [Candidatus Paceibacterota bacterium]|jgi:Co/Zn/Cd efflux system component
MQKDHGDDCCAINLENSGNKNIKTVLIIVFLINFGMFFVEIIGGFIAHSNSLLADSLDMLGDAFIYGITIAVMSKHPSVRAKGSLAKGIIMLLLGVFVFAEIIFKIINPVVPTAGTITIIGFAALMANAVSFILLYKHRSTDLNVRSSWLCSRNDMLANVGVIAAGFLVAHFNSIWPDITIGFIIALIVIRSSLQIIIESLRHINNREVCDKE